MATTKSQSKKTSTKRVNDLSEVGSIINPDALDNATVTVCASPAPLLSPTGKFMYVTSMHLRRSVLTGDTVKHCKLVVDGDVFRAITAAGLKNGVTWDEMARAVFTEQMHNPIPFATSAKFLPISDEI